MDEIDGTASFRNLAPQAALAPVVLDSPHSGSRYPDAFGSLAPLPVLRRGADALADALFGSAPGPGAALTAPAFPRIHLPRQDAASGKSVSVRSDLGGCRTLKKK